MKIVVAYAGRRHPDVLAATPAGTEWCDVSGDPHGYWRVLVAAWEETVATGEDLAVIEHDVVCRPDVIEQFKTCPQPWCLFEYSDTCHPQCREAWANHLGCTRFRNELIRAKPNAVARLPVEQRDWHNLCDHIAGDKIDGVPVSQHPEGLRARFTHHWHTPPVTHITRNVDPDFWYGPGGRYAAQSRGG